jgi:hypothetical protein
MFVRFKSPKKSSKGYLSEKAASRQSSAISQKHWFAFTDGGELMAEGSNMAVGRRDDYKQDCPAL